MSKIWPLVKTDKIYKTLARLTKTKKKKKKKTKLLISEIKLSLLST